MWQYKNITIGNSLVYEDYQEWYRAGIFKVKDIVNENGKFKTQQDVERCYNISVKYMQYNSLKDAIPHHWRVIMKLNDEIVNDVSTSEAVSYVTKSSFKTLKKYK